MTKYTATITADGDYFLCDVNKKRDLVNFFYTGIVYGTGGNNFGSGTVTLKISPNGGTTKLALKDASGSDITSTADDNYTGQLAGGNTNSDAPKLYASMSGSTAPSVTYVLYDNNG
jgi:hypothetical protein